jgi:5-methylcytosine-specific restriction endonuclease McrA
MICKNCDTEVDKLSYNGDICERCYKLIWSQNNSDRLRVYWRNWHRSNPDKIRRYNVAGKYGGGRGRCFNRDNYMCTACSTSDNLHIHHIDGNKDNHDLENLTTLCHDCHWDEHRKMIMVGHKYCLVQEGLWKSGKKY